jgi:hypothetical protein
MNNVPEIDADALLDEHDEHILNGLAAMYSEADPVPDDLVARSQFAITLDALHAEIAELQRWGADSMATRAESPTGVETITFSSSALTTMVTVTAASADTVRIDGWAAPGPGLPVELRLETGSLHTVADEDGRFVFDEVRRGLAQFVLRPVNGQPVITPSLQL